MFIQPCFIRKNTPELIEKLEELGYKKNIIYLEYEHNLYAGGGIYSSANFIDKYYFDCGTNEELFLGLAALRDDSDYMQWFTDGKKWFKFGGIIQNGFIIDIETHLVYHKATVKEILEHFKDK